MSRRDRKRHLSDLESDIHNYIEIETQDNIARGMSAEEARYAAMRKFGNVTRVMEDTREVWAIRWLDHLVQDLRFALRGIRKSPLFACIVVITLALGIGANTTIFTIIDSIVLRTIPVSNPQQLVVFSWKARKDPDLQGHSSFGDCDNRPGQTVRIDCSLSVPYFQAVRAHTSDSFSQVAAFSGPITVDFAGYGKAAMAQGTYVSGDFFSMLGVPMAIGRVIGPDDDTQSAASVIVLDYNYWRTAFASDPNIVGRSVRLNDTSAIIVGVTAQSFTNLMPGKSQNFYMPLSLVLHVRSEWWENGDRLFDPASFWVVIISRLQPGVSIAQARAAADTVFRNETIHGAKPLFTAADDPTINLYSIKQGLQGENVYYTPMLYTMMVAVGIVLLIACANVAGLMLARSARRQKEMALRIAIGAGRGRILRQLLTESVLLSTLGGALGVLLAVWGVKAIVHFMAGTSEGGFPYVIEPNGRILIFSVATTFVTGILFGLAPARRCARVDVNPALKESPSFVGKRSTARWLHLGDALVVAQVALSIIVAVGAGLLVRSLQNLRDIDPGFTTENLLVFGINPELAGYTSSQSAQLYRNLQEHFAALPGVTSVSYSNDTLLSGGQSGTDIHFDGAPPDINPIVDAMSVGLNFFSTMGIPSLAGRGFTDSDFVSAMATENALRAADQAARDARKPGHTPRRFAPELVTTAPIPVLINRSFAQEYFANQNAVGKDFGPSEHHREVDGQPGYLIIGVVGDTKYSSLRRPIKPTMFQPLLSNSAHYELRTKVDPATLIPAVREVVSAADSNLPIFEISTQSERIDRLLFQERLMTRASSFFGILTLALACFELYGLLSYEIAWRTRELGVRMALGAQSRDILSLVIKQVIAIVAIGVAVGIAPR
jgi:predicted permease